MAASAVTFSIRSNSVGGLLGQKYEGIGENCSPMSWPVRADCSSGVDCSSRRKGGSGPPASLRPASAALPALAPLTANSGRIGSDDTGRPASCIQVTQVRPGTSLAWCATWSFVKLYLPAWRSRRRRVTA